MKLSKLTEKYTSFTVALHYNSGPLDSNIITGITGKELPEVLRTYLTQSYREGITGKDLDYLLEIRWRVWKALYENKTVQFKLYGCVMIVHQGGSDTKEEGFLTIG